MVTIVISFGTSEAAATIIQTTSRMITELIGWFSTIVLCMTISRQVHTQWKTKSTAGVSRWLFIGQLTASAGFVVYSFLLDNWVFVFSNVFLLLTALIGQALYLRNRKDSGETPEG